MNKDTIKEIIYILIAIILGLVIVKFIIWLLPVLLIGIVAYLIWKNIKKNNNVNINNNRSKKRKIKVIHDDNDVN